MFGVNFWIIIRVVYIIIKALLAMPPENGDKLPDLKDDS
ncbi:hypothetical protein ES703_84013 [subsurface metagenome]